MPNLSVYQIVTERFIDALKQDIIPWQKPWKADDEVPINRVSGKPYRGINVMLLGISAMVKGYTSNEWLTYNQATGLGGTVKKGEKSSLVTFWKVSKYEKEGKSGVTEEKKGFLLRYYNVFNLDQCEGIEPRNKREEKAPRTVFQVQHDAERIVNGWNGPTLKHGRSLACYSPELDMVSMPFREAFVSPMHYYHTLFHELVHSTGHKTRLDRDLSGGRMSNPYAKEELIAEIGASFLSAHCGIDVVEVKDSQKAYIQHWISHLERDEKLILQASSAAQKAVDLIYHWEEVEESEAA